MEIHIHTLIGKILTFNQYPPPSQNAFEQVYIYEQQKPNFLPLNRHMKIVQEIQVFGVETQEHPKIRQQTKY